MNKNNGCDPIFFALDMTGIKCFYYYVDMRNILLLYKLLAFLMAPFLLMSCATLAGVGESGPSPKEENTFPYDRYVEGQPNIDLRVEGGCYIWRDGNNWHVRIAKKLDRPRTLSIIGPVITGKVRVRHGNLTNFSNFNLTTLNDVRFFQRNISFKFELRNDNLGNDIEGFDFAVKPTAPEYCITFDLLVDGATMPGIIHLGSFMHIPETMPLEICLHSFD
jgi:hypothetical protein